MESLVWYQSHILVDLCFFHVVKSHDSPTGKEMLKITTVTVVNI